MKGCRGPQLYGRKAWAVMNPTLTKREKQIAELVVTGRDQNKAIADQLGIAEDTVKAHLYSIYNKLGIDNRMHLAVWWKDQEIDALNRRLEKLEAELCTMKKLSDREGTD